MSLVTIEYFHICSQIIAKYPGSRIIELFRFLAKLIWIPYVLCNFEQRFAVAYLRLDHDPRAKREHHKREWGSYANPILIGENERKWKSQTTSDESACSRVAGVSLFTCASGFSYRCLSIVIKLPVTLYRIAHRDEGDLRKEQGKRKIIGWGEQRYERETVSVTRFFCSNEPAKDNSLSAPSCDDWICLYIQGKEIPRKIFTRTIIHDKIFDQFFYF